MDVQAIALALAWVVIFALSCVLATLARQVHELRGGGGPASPRIESGLVVGAAFPTPPEIDRFPQGPREKILAFLSSDCIGCRIVGPALPALAAEFPNAIVVALFVTETPENLDGTDLPANMMVLPNMSQLFSEIEGTVMPFIVVVGSDNSVICSGAVGNPDMLHDLVAGGMHSERTVGAR